MINISDILGTGGSGGASGGLAGQWNMASSSALPNGHGPGLMYEITGNEATRDGQRFVAGDIAMVNLDNSTVVNLTSRMTLTSSSSYLAFDPLKGSGVFSNGNKTVSVGPTSVMAAQLTETSNANLMQSEITVDAKGTNGTYFAVGTVAGDILSALMTSTAECLVVAAYLESPGTWAYLSIINNVTDGPIPITGLPNLVTGDVVTIGFDKNTRVMRIAVNGTEATMPNGPVPGTASMTFACVGVGGSPQLTINTGPTFQHGFSGYSGTYTTVNSYAGPLRLIGTNWDPTGGYPSYASLLPGDMWYASITGTIGGTTYYSGQGIWYDGGSWRPLEDGPYTVNGMIWMGDLKPTLASPGLAAGALPAVSSADDGKTWRLTGPGYVQGAGTDLSYTFPEGGIVTVKNGKYVLFSYDPAKYEIPRTTSMQATEGLTWFQGKTISPLIGSGYAYTPDSGQFELTLKRKRTNPVIPDYAGVYMPFAEDGVTTQTAMSTGLSVYIDMYNDGIYVMGSGSPSQLYSFASDPLLEGDIITFITTAYSNDLLVYKNEKRICQFDTYSVLGASLYQFPYTFALFSNITYDGSRWYPNNGRTPFSFCTSPTGQYYQGFPVKVNGGAAVLTVNSVVPDSGGNVALSAATVGAIPTSEKAQALGVATLDTYGYLVQKTLDSFSNVAFSTVVAENGKVYYASGGSGSLDITGLPAGGHCYVVRKAQSIGSSPVYIRNGAGFPIFVNNSSVGGGLTVAANVEHYGQVVKVTCLGFQEFLMTNEQPIGLTTITGSINLDTLTVTGKYALFGGWQPGTGPVTWTAGFDCAVLETVSTNEIAPGTTLSYDCQSLQKLHIGNGMTFKRIMRLGTWGSWRIEGESKLTYVCTNNVYSIPLNVGTVLVTYPGDVNLYLTDSSFADKPDGVEVTVKKVSTETGTITINSSEEIYSAPLSSTVSSGAVILRGVGESVTLKYSKDKNCWYVYSRYSPPGVSSWIHTTADTTILVSSFYQGAHIRTTSATAVSVTLPADADGYIPIGVEIPVTMADLGPVTFTAAAGVTITNPLRTIATQWDVVVAKKVAANTWDLIGPVT